MNIEGGYVIINAIAYCLVPIYLYWKHHAPSDVLYLSILWAFSAVSSIFYYFSPIYDFFISDSINPLSLIFYFICYLGLLYPLLSLNSSTLRITVTPQQWNVLMPIIYIIVIASILPIIENFNELFKGGLSGVYQLGEKYEEISSDMRNGFFKSNLSLPSRMLMARFLNPLVYITPILFFLYLGKKDKDIRLAVLLFLSSILFGIMTLSRGQRSILTSQMLYMVYLFLLFKNTIPYNQYKKIKKIGLIVGGIFGFFFLSITMSRTGLYEQIGGDSNDVILATALRYYGEHFFNFGTMLFESDPFCMGDYWANFYSSNPQGWDYWTRRLGCPAQLFYGTIGDFYKDFSLYSLPLIIVGGFMLKKCKMSHVSTAIFLLMWSILLTNGLFACFFEFGLTPFPCLIIAIILKLKKI